VGVRLLSFAKIQRIRDILFPLFSETQEFADLLASSGELSQVTQPQVPYIKASNFGLHGNFGLFLASSIASLDEKMKW
jgi:hypothetical protein